MEEAIAERPTSQALQINQYLTSHNGSVGPTDTKRPGEPSHDRFARRQTCLSRTHVPSGNFYRPFFRMCRDFMRGSCTYGDSCKFRHSESDKHDVASKENDPSVHLEFGHYRSRSPCRNFLRGRCNNGPSCRRLHIEINEVEEELRSHSINRERRSRSPCRKFLRGSYCAYMHDKPTKYQQGFTYVKNAIRSTVSGDDMGLASRDRSCEGKRTVACGEKIKECCLKFSKGRCDRGDSCRYLHSFHEYAKSNPVPSNEQLSKNILSHYHVGNGPCSSEEMQNVNDSVSQDGALDDSLNPNVLNQKRESRVIDGKGVADDDISLWSQPFKRRRSWWESSFTHKDDFSCRSVRRDEFQNNFTRHRNYNVVPFRYHHCSLSRYRFDSHRPHSRATTSINLPSRQVDKDSNTENPNQNSEWEHVKDGVRLGIVEKSHTPSDSHLHLDQKIDISEGQVGASPKEAEFESTSPCEYDTSLRNDSGVVSISLSQERGETSEAMKVYSRKRRKVTCFIKPPSSSCAKTSLGCANNVSVVGASDEQANKETTNEIRMETCRSLIKEANLSFNRKLLILDVNGILADIVAYYPETFKPDTIVSMKGVFKRPFCDDFLDFCFERFDVGVWSSRNKKNVDHVTDFLMGDSKKKLLFCWDQSYCTDTGYKTIENKSKPLVLKELKRLWEKQVDDLPWEKGYYNETNTILLDDSPYKALRNPSYTAVFPFPFTFRDRKDTDLGHNGKLRLYLERLSEAQNVQKFIQENPFGQRPITKSNLLWRFYSKIIEDNGTLLLHSIIL